MGLMRRVETRLQGGFERVFGKGSGSGIQPAEIARKLVKEMEDHKTDSFSRIYAPNRFTVYLHPEDRAMFAEYEGSLSAEFETHVGRHARREGYSLVGPPHVSITSDSDLRPGQFGILAEMIEGLPEFAPADPVSWPGVATQVSPVASASPTPPPPMPARASASAAPSAATAAPAGRSSAGDTQGISREQAQQMGLARQTVLLRRGPQIQEFDKSRVVLGRSRDADFRLDDPNVSRRHAVLYWEDGGMFVKDLRSTNGTLLNGRPVTSSPLHDGDIITVGACTIVVETEP